MRGHAKLPKVIAEVRPPHSAQKAHGAKLATNKMDTEKIRGLTPYQDINSLLAYWTEKAKNILGENVVGLYLSGSLSYGDFEPPRVSRRLQFLRGWNHENKNEIFAGVP
jgi:hypothetical protein